jgi:hypothetical protein
MVESEKTRSVVVPKMTNYWAASRITMILSLAEVGMIFLTEALERIYAEAVREMTFFSVALGISQILSLATVDMIFLMEVLERIPAAVVRVWTGS